MSDDTAYETTLTENLRAVPIDARAEYEHHSTSHSIFPYGAYCHSAAARIEKIEAEIATLKVKSGVWGFMAGCVPVIIALLVRLLFIK